MKHTSEIKRINYLCTELGAIYHKCALKLGISDSITIVLYAIYDAGNECLLQDIYKTSGVSKQTINSAIRNLEKDGILKLEQYNKKAKKVVLTEKGKDLVNQTAAKLYQAESDAFNSWTKEEIETYISLMEKYNDCLRAQLQKL